MMRTCFQLLYICHHHSGCIISVCLFQSPVVPLYLGADLFSNTDIRTENHPRHHAKFAKKGLATKIHFSSGEIAPEKIVP